MKMGTKSLLFGVHQFAWHPITVWLAWRHLFNTPTFKETICIIIHDWGYWGCKSMNEGKGNLHPILGSLIADHLFGKPYAMLCLLHSRFYSKLLKLEPSKLCWADKYSITYDPCWLYGIRAYLSGELQEYREYAAQAGEVPLSSPYSIWYKWFRNFFKSQGESQQSHFLKND